MYIRFHWMGDPHWVV